MRVYDIRQNPPLSSDPPLIHLSDTYRPILPLSMISLDTSSRHIASRCYNSSHPDTQTLHLTKRLLTVTYVKNGVLPKKTLCIHRSETCQKICFPALSIETARKSVKRGWYRIYILVSPFYISINSTTISPPLPLLSHTILVSLTD